jgi:hypothetical protein
MVSCVSIGDKRKLVRNVKSYLETKYEREFVCKDPEMSWIAPYGSGAYNVTAYPKDLPEVEVNIQCNTALQPSQDNFLDKLWSYQGKIAETDTIKNAYGDDVFFTFSFYMASNIQKEIGAEVNMLDYNKVVEKYSDKCYYNIRIYCFLDSPFDEVYQLEKAKGFIKSLIIDRNFVTSSPNIAYIDRKYKEEFMKTIAKSEPDRVSYDFSESKDSLHQVGLVYNQLYIDYKYGEEPTYKFIY